LKNDFRNIHSEEAEVILIEGADHILPTFSLDLSEKAVKSLQKLGVTVRTHTKVTDIQSGCVFIGSETIPSKTILWAAGVQASRMGVLCQLKGSAELDRIGRVKVNPDLSVGQYKNLFVIGDLAHVTDASGNPLPGVAPVAMQQGRYVADLLLKKTSKPFHYHDKGSLAVIGRNAAVAQSGRLHLSGFPAWLAWAFIHIYYLIEFDNKLLVMLQWALNYFTRKKGARLITE
jgi:NADH dehydrogenase